MEYKGWTVLKREVQQGENTAVLGRDNRRLLVIKATKFPRESGWWIRREWDEKTFFWRDLPAPGWGVTSWLSVEAAQALGLELVPGAPRVSEPIDLSGGSLRISEPIEEDQLFLKKVLEDVVPHPTIAAIIKKAFDLTIPRKAIDFKTHVVGAIKRCLEMHGIPMFRTRYASQPFPMSAVLMVCYGSRNGRMKGVWFKDVPKEDLAILAAKMDGYTEILRRYGGTVGPGWP